MIRFLLRKFFYDLWDNLFKVILLNLGFLGTVVLALTAPSLLAFYPPLSLAVFAVLVFAAFVYVCAAALVLKEASDYRSFGAVDFFAALKPACRSGLVLGGLVLAGFFLVRFAIPFYLALGGLVGVVFAAVCFWTVVTLAVAFQFLPAVFSRLEKRPLRAVKKCLIFFFDNTPFSLFSFFFVIFLLLPVIFFPAFPLLYLDEALRLRFLKYDRLPAKATEDGKLPKGGKQKIPWNEILAEEMEKTGKRNWKDFVFPWRS
jgi:MFS family permease